ncbi:MAG: DUF924 family protein [Usitatibacter sp.]
MATAAREVLDFWFGPEEARGIARPEWFRKDEKFDAEIRRRFAALHASAALAECESWRGDRQSMLALVVVLDQFSRNLYRSDARAFSQDAHALGCAREALARGDDEALRPVERQFLYMPFEHSEDPADQDRAVELMRSLDEFPQTRGLVRWAESHRAVIRRFGRFPHRNAALGRPTTAEEAAFLREPGSSF